MISFYEENDLFRSNNRFTDYFADFFLFYFTLIRCSLQKCIAATYVLASALNNLIKLNGNIINKRKLEIICLTNKLLSQRFRNILSYVRLL